MLKITKFVQVAVGTMAAVMLTACAGTTAPPADAASGGSSNEQAAPAGKATMTDVGTPRNDTLVVDMLQGRAASVSQLNPYLPGVVYQGNGFRQVIWEPLWDVDSIAGKQIPILAEGMAEPIDESYTKFKVKLREGIKWSDGVDFTADDVVFTSDMLLKTPEIAYGKAFAGTVKSITALDKYTIQIETTQRETRIEQFLGVTVVDCNFKILPKHIWEKEDPKTFTNTACIATGPYTLEKVDPQGNWFLYEKRPDWNASATGILTGEPKPGFVLFRTYGTEEKRVMAAIQNDIDILCDISPESWTVLSGKNPEAIAWYENFPYADMDDPAARGVLYNCEKELMNDVDIRWALQLATDLNSISISTYSGMLRASPLILAPTTALSRVYHAPMVPWMQELTLSDGYKPFDENFAVNMVETLKKQGVQGLPSDPQAVKDIFGVGWWKHDPAQAEKILTSKGFKRDSGGKWLKPDGSKWQLSLVSPSGFEVIAERLGYAIVDSWQKFGIDAVVQPCDSATYQANISSGNFDAAICWPSMSVISDAIGGIRTWHSSNVVPSGENAPTGYNTGACSRWKSEKVDKILDELITLSSDDPRVTELVTEFQKEIVINVPFAPFIGTSKLVPATTHYWSNIQTSENAYEGPWWWWSNFKYSLAKYEPTGAN